MARSGGGSRSGSLPPGGSGNDRGPKSGRGQDVVQMTLRVPLRYRCNFKRWALDRNQTMSDLLLQELQPPDYKSDNPTGKPPQ
jgi:hypothetical protein